MSATIAQLQAATKRMSAEDERESRERLLGSITELERRVKDQFALERFFPPDFDRSLLLKAGLGPSDDYPKAAQRAIAALGFNRSEPWLDRIVEQMKAPNLAIERISADSAVEAVMGFNRIAARMVEQDRITDRLLDYERITKGIGGADYLTKAVDAALDGWWDRSSARIESAFAEFARPRYLDAMLRDMRADDVHLFADAVEEALPQEAAVEAFTTSDLAEVERQRARVANGPLLELMDAIIRDPRIRYEADWRAIEQIVAEIYKAQGCSHVQLGKGSKDGGIDVVATMPTPIGDMVIGAQVKRRSKKNTVKPEVLHAFYTVITHRGYNQGVLFTTTTVQPAAKAFMSEKNTFMRAVEGEELVELIRWLRGVI